MIFTARRVCIARTSRGKMCVCLSVSLSVTPPVFCLNGYTYPQSFFSPLDSPTIPVFPHQTGWKYSDGDSPNGGVECNEYEKNHDFRSISRFILELVQYRAIVSTEGE